MSSQSTPESQKVPNRLKSKIEQEPLIASRLLLFATIWALALTNLVIVVREFEHTLPFVVGLGPSGRPSRFGIEDSRRQSLPVLVASSIVIVSLIPFTVGLPLFGFAEFLTRYIIEACWSSVVALLLLGSAAALAPLPTSPLLPRRLQSELSITLGLSFIIFVLLMAYNVLLLLRICFLLGRGNEGLLHTTVPSLLDIKRDQSKDVDEALESGTIKSGWDDDEEVKKKGSKEEKMFWGRASK